VTLLVTGASGLLGANLVVTALDAGLPVAAVSQVHRLRASIVPNDQADLSEPGVAAALFRRIGPSAVVHTAAATNIDACEADPAHAFRMNQSMAREVAAASASVGARLIHISTDAVFAGDLAGGYAEDDPTEPRNVYGRAKLGGEQAVLAVHPGALVVRTTIFGWNALPKTSLAEWFLDRFRRGARAPGFSDAEMTPILVNDLADRILRLVDMASVGVLHVTGRECIAKADFGRRLARAYGYAPDLVDPVGLDEASLAAPRARRPCLRVERAEALLGRMPTVEDGIARFRRLDEAGFPARLRGLLEEVS